MSTLSTGQQEYTWERQPEADALVHSVVNAFLAQCPKAGELAKLMLTETATRFGDWVDHIEMPASMGLDGKLEATGFELVKAEGATTCYWHPGAIFPRVLIGRDEVMRVCVKVESVADFLFTWKLDSMIEGEVLGVLRKAKAWGGEKSEMWVIERHGYDGFAVKDGGKDHAAAMLKHGEALRLRKRDFEDEGEGFKEAEKVVDATVKALGADTAADLFFAGERGYWMSRNRAARAQKQRQDSLGLGWANHDHHTFRCSRRYFPNTIRMLEKLGMHCREKFYAGQEAGWGAQVLEQPVTGIVVFADVDLAPQEVEGDFAHDGLVERDELGTVGLWCALHGDSFVQAGMHHLECQFDFESLTKQLAEKEGVGMMSPFSNFPHLKQAFTEGERWKVDAKRVDKLREAGRITREQAEQFVKHGALGSHLENLERNDGYKGFNQKAVSDIIARTDPRTN